MLICACENVDDGILTAPYGPISGCERSAEIGVLSRRLFRGQFKEVSIAKLLLWLKLHHVGKF